MSWLLVTTVDLHRKLLILCLFLLSTPSFSIASSLIKKRDNPLGLDYDPAPPPDKGPPLSAGALRDPAYLPAEIGGIFGAYVVFVGLIGIALFTVGRRLRKATERAKRALEVEMIKAPQHMPSPVEPRSPQNFSRPSPDKAERNPYVYPINAQSNQILPVDARSMSTDRENMDKGLEDLYAHVMAQEEAKIRSREVSLASGSQPPLSPGSQRSIFPAAQPQRANIRPVKGRPEGMTLDTSAKPKPQSRASSIISTLRSPRKKTSGGRNVQISSPLPTPLSQTFSPSYASDEEPLSPVYAIPRPPPVPEGQTPYSHSRNVSANDFSPVTPESPENSRTPRLDTINVNAQLGKKSSGTFDNQQPPFSPQTPVFPNSPLTPRAEASNFPTGPTRPNLSQQTSQPNLSIRTATNKISSGNPLNSNPLAKASTASLAPTNNSTRTLPFRAYDPPAGLHSPTFSHTTKTTILERTTPLSPSGKTPWTGASVPYSPYQPHTPVTPFSPRLVTKQERKLRKKIEGRTPVMELCKGEDDLWDSAY